MGKNSEVRFYDETGQISGMTRCGGGCFDVVYETGKTLVVLHSESGEVVHRKGFPSTLIPDSTFLYRYDAKGVKEREIKIPFTGSTIAAGISPDGRYAALTSHLGWMKYFDFETSEEVWHTEFSPVWLYDFRSIPISSDGGYVIFAGLIQNLSQKCLIYVFDIKGNLIGAVDPYVPPEMLSECRIRFLPESTRFIKRFRRHLMLFEVTQEDTEVMLSEMSSPYKSTDTTFPESTPLPTPTIYPTDLPWPTETPFPTPISKGKYFQGFEADTDGWMWSGSCRIVSSHPEKKEYSAKSGTASGCYAFCFGSCTESVELESNRRSGSLISPVILPNNNTEIVFWSLEYVNSQGQSSDRKSLAISFDYGKTFGELWDIT